MKNPLVITPAFLKNMVDSFHQSEFAKRKLEIAKKAFEKDRSILNQLSNSKKM